MFKQKLLLLDITLLILDKQDCHKAISIIYDALKISFAMLILGDKKSFEIDIDILKAISFKDIEYRLFLAMAICYEQLGDLSATVNLLYGIELSLEDQQVVSEIKKKVYPHVCFVLSNHLQNQADFEQSLHICHKGLDFCLENDIGRFRGFFYHILSYYEFYFENNHDRAYGFGKKSYDAFIYEGFIYMALSIKEITNKHYGLII